MKNRYNDLKSNLRSILSRFRLELLLSDLLKGTAFLAGYVLLYFFVYYCFINFFPVTVWWEAAVNCNKFLAKGSQVGVCGSLQIRRYDDKDGIKRTAIDLQADEVEFLSARNESAPASPNNKPEVKVSELDEVEDDDMPF